MRLTLLVAIFLSLSGCQVPSVAQVDRSDYLLAEPSGTTRLHVVQLAIENIFPAASDLHRTFLVEQVPQTVGSSDARRIMAIADKNRDLDRIWRAAESITKNARSAQIRWIVSTQPLAVAIGRETPKGDRLFMGVDSRPRDQRGGLVLLGMNQRLVTEANLNEPVETVFMQDEWTGGWEGEDAKHTVTVHLQHGTTIGQLIREWPPREMTRPHE